MPEPHHSVFTVPVLFLTPNQQCQSTEGNMLIELLLVFVEPDFFFQHSNTPRPWTTEAGLHAGCPSNGVKGLTVLKPHARPSTGIKPGNVSSKTQEFKTCVTGIVPATR